MRLLAFLSLLAIVAAPAAAQPRAGALDAPGGLGAVDAIDEAGRAVGAPPSAVRTQATGAGLHGTFGVDPGQCDDGPVTEGSYFRMIQPGGDAESGPFVQNGDSPCGENTFTPLEPGQDGGLSTTDHQPHPDPAFGPTGGGLADRITTPTRFFGVDFAVATNPVDPQTGEDVPAPVVSSDGGSLSGDLRAFAVAWNRQHFNQGSPKPDGSAEGNTAPVEGTYDEATGRYTLTWTSQIEGGPFNGFSGLWRLEGTFQPAAADPEPTEPAPPADPDPTQPPATPPPGTTAQPTAAPTATPDTGLGLPLAAGLALLAAAAGLRPSRRHGRPGRRR